MANILDDPGVLQVVLEEYEKRKLPRMATIKESVDGGERLDVEELAFLRELYKEINSYESFVEGHAEFKELYVSFVRLYCSIMDAALDNEQRK
ncbi:MAG: hypothetical protein OQL16_12795 [Gammaproteobacteria bacterium]|nr:hypothetical protein [Gammaproteobacteria bacterium]